jgi:hypothetical protein
MLERRSVSGDLWPYRGRRASLAMRGTERIREERDALVGGDHRDRQIAGVAAANEPELLLGPVDRESKHLRASLVEAVGSFAELRAEAPERTAVAGGQRAVGGEGADERLEPGLWRAVALERVEQCVNVVGFGRRSLPR